MTKDEKARARLVEIALQAADMWPHMTVSAEAYREKVRKAAGFKNPRTGSWCAAGLTAAMEDAGLVVPAPGTPARRGAVALLDFVRTEGVQVVSPSDAQMWLNGRDTKPDARPGDVIAWLQNKAPAEWLHVHGEQHAFAIKDAARSMCGKAGRATALHLAEGGRCSSCVWETRKGHVALIVAVDDESITTVGWNEGNAPGRVMKRRLWRKPHDHVPVVKPSSTVLYRRPGGIYGIARPIAR